jgi:EAL domain-containing protein (putative c-di-GMP-specific phosphodiesterase class I)
MLLQAAGCDEMQGYLFSPPGAASALRALLGGMRTPVNSGGVVSAA